jgi:hypothetical protein
MAEDGPNPEMVVSHVLDAIKDGLDEPARTLLLKVGAPPNFLDLLVPQDPSKRLMGAFFLATWFKDNRADVIGAATIHRLLAETLTGSSDPGLSALAPFLETILDEYCAEANATGRGEEVLAHASDWAATMEARGRADIARHISGSNTPARCSIAATTNPRWPCWIWSRPRSHRSPLRLAMRFPA